jgi:hypothetical protein
MRTRVSWAERVYAFRVYCISYWLCKRDCSNVMTEAAGLTRACRFYLYPEVSADRSKHACSSTHTKMSAWSTTLSCDSLPKSSYSLPKPWYSLSKSHDSLPDPWYCSWKSYDSSQNHDIFYQNHKIPYQSHDIPYEGNSFFCASYFKKLSVARLLAYTTNGKMTGKWWSDKKQSWPNRDTVWRDWGKPWKSLATLLTLRVGKALVCLVGTWRPTSSHNRTTVHFVLEGVIKK